MADLSLIDAVTGIAAGAVCALVIGAGSAAVAVRWRARVFERGKRSAAPLPAWFPESAAPERAARHRQRDRAMREELAALHVEAKRLQDLSAAQLAATSTTLLCAFAISVLSVTLWDSGRLHILSAAFDLVALCYAFFAFRRSGRYRAAWLRQRAITEFLRQWLNVEYLLAPEEKALAAKVDALVSGWKDAISQAPDKLIESVTEVAGVRAREMTARLKASDLSDAALRSYYAGRPQRQARWFAASLERLERSRHGRKLFIEVTFFGALAAACTKLAALLFHNEGLSHLALLILLICIGLAGASSSAYLGQNQRSLKHRYRQQLHAIEGWVRSAARDGIVARLNGANGVKKAAILRDIHAFEHLMAIELLDWLAISMDDAMELAPS